MIEYARCIITELSTYKMESENEEQITDYLKAERQRVGISKRCLNLLRGLGALLAGLDGGSASIRDKQRQTTREQAYLGGEELGENVGEDTTLRDDDGSQELVELLVVSDSELQVSGHDTRLLVVSGSVTGKLEDLGSEVCQVRQHLITP